jgi:hypothetical protein
MSEKINIHLNWKHSDWGKFMKYSIMLVAFAIICMRDVNLTKFPQMALLLTIFILPLIAMFIRRMCYQIDVKYVNEELAVLEFCFPFRRRVRLKNPICVKRVVYAFPGLPNKHYIIVQNPNETISFGKLLSNENLNRIANSLNEMNRRANQ